MKFLFNVVKKMCLGIFGIYSMNLLFSLVNIIVPINLFTIFLSTVFGFWGIVSVIVMQLLI